MPRLPTADVPQADNLRAVREVVEAVSLVGTAPAALEAHTGFSGRHIRYRLQSGRIWGFVTASKELTTLGRAFLATDAGSPAEMRLLRKAIRASAIVKLIVPDLLSSATFDLATVAERISAASELSPATAVRRAQVLRAWRRQVSP